MVSDGHATGRAGSTGLAGDPPCSSSGKPGGGLRHRRLNGSTGWAEFLGESMPLRAVYRFLRANRGLVVIERRLFQCPSGPRANVDGTPERSSLPTVR